MAAERKAEVDNAREKREVEAARREAESSDNAFSTEDRQLSGSFANNKGRLPMPMSGRIISHYGQYSVEGLHNVQLSNNGINIKGSPGAAVRIVFAGEVSAVFGFHRRHGPSWLLHLRLLQPRHRQRPQGTEGQCPPVARHRQRRRHPPVPATQGNCQAQPRAVVREIKRHILTSITPHLSIKKAGKIAAGKGSILLQALGDQK